MYKKLHVNIPFDEEIVEMPKYDKFLKEITSNKKKMEDFTIVSLNEECSIVVLKKMPLNLKDPRSFLVLCAISNLSFDRSLCDVGASINLRPYSVYKKLGLQEP